MFYKAEIFRNLYTSLLLFLLLLLPATALGQLLPSGTEEKTETAADFPADSLNRRTPRGTVNGFIKAMADQNHLRASQYLQLKRSLRNNRQRERIVLSFQKLLDQSGNVIPTALISNKTTGRLDDDLPPNRDLVGTVTANGEEITLYVENNEPENMAPLWLFSAETVNYVANATIEETSILDSMSPESLNLGKIAGVPVTHWLAVVLLVLLAYLAAWLLVAFAGFIIRNLWKKARVEEKWKMIKTLGLPFRLYFAVLLFAAFSQYVGISIIIRQRFSAMTVTIGIIAFLILLWRLIDIIGDYTKNRMTLRKRISAISIILFLKRMAKASIFIIGIIAILGAIGFDITTWLAALGIGGIALALGAQKTMENFVGSVSLIADQPIRVGDFCKVGEISGTVESIGMRSTRLRTSKRTVVTIPNGSFSNNNIENFAHRDQFLFDPVLEFRLETTPDQLRYLLVEIRTLLYSHENINPSPARVRFTGITASAYKIEIFAYIEAVDFNRSQEIQEDLLLRILDIVAASGTDFAYPSQTIYFARDKGLDHEKTEDIETMVKNWKEKGELRLPSFEKEYIEKLKNSIKFPPEGSVEKP